MQGQQDFRTIDAKIESVDKVCVCKENRQIFSLENPDARDKVRLLITVSLDAMHFTTLHAITRKVAINQRVRATRRTLFLYLR